MSKISRKAARLLGLKKPYKIIYRESLKSDACADYSGMYIGKKLIYHRIRINVSALQMEGARNLDTLFVHELIHAWQEENGIKDVHGKEFKRQARILEKVFSLTEVYIKQVDE